MKKIFTLFLLAVGLAIPAAAQIEFVYDGNVLPDGSEFNVYAHTIDYGGGFTFTEYSGNDPFIKNTGDKATTISVTIKKDNPEDAINWCGVTGQCAFINAGVEKATRSTSVKPGESVGVGAHFTFDEGVYKTVSFDVIATGGGVTRTIHMNIIYAEAAGIQGTQVENAVKVSGKQLSYNFGDSTERTLSVYSSTGRLVKQEQVHKSGSLSLAGLYKGVYLYAVTENGRRVTTHKFILK